MRKLIDLLWLLNKQLMGKITMTHLRKEIAVTLNIEELAEAFWGLNSKEQAEFFNHLGLITKVKKNNDFKKQMLYVREEGLTDEAKEVMRIIGE